MTTSFPSRPNGLARLRRSIATFACVLAVLIGGTAQADAAVIFVVSGTFEDGSILDGTLTIDTDLGTITGAQITAGSPANLTFVNIIGQGDLGDPFFYSATVRNAEETYDFNFGVPLHSLAGYAGGPLCGLTSVDCAPSNLYDLVADDFGAGLVSGELTPTPEPSLAVLTGLLLIGVAAVRKTHVGRS